MIVDCFNNDARDDSKQDNFIYWPYYLEIDSSNTADSKKFIQDIRNLIGDLKSQSFHVVPSCDFEDELTA